MLSDIRRLFGYTQKELAEKIGIDQRYYTQLETGGGKSSRLISELSKVLKIDESFLAPVDKYVEYPFLSDFYVFCMTEKKVKYEYDFFIKQLCSRSKFIDMVFLLAKPSVFPSWFETRMSFFAHPVVYIAIKDDHGTIFILKRHVRTRKFSIKRNSEEKTRQNGEKETVIRTFPLVDFFREMIHSTVNFVHETTRIVDEELVQKIEGGTAIKDDIASYFPNDNYFLAQYEAHKDKKR